MKRSIICLSILLAMAAIILFFLNPKKDTQSIQSSPPAVVRLPNIKIIRAITNSIALSATNIATQDPSRPASATGRGAWERAMNEKDPDWEYKLPISFYGKVVDDSNQPISGVNVAFSWMDLSKEGTTQQNTVSDASGNFSLVGKTGKSLTVQV